MSLQVLLWINLFQDASKFKSNADLTECEDDLKLLYHTYFLKFWRKIVPSKTNNCPKFSELVQVGLTLSQVFGKLAYELLVIESTHDAQKDFVLM